MSERPLQPRSFEEALAELEHVVRDLEDGQTGLEESLGRYERGVSLIKRCYAQLREAEQRILVLTGTDEDGQPTLQPFQHQASAGPPSGETRRARPRSKDTDSTIPF